ncbi:MAG: putative bifunctional diguanylate cyclase/phosphodiesterase [Thermoleophilaceae bacterium]
MKRPHLTDLGPWLKPGLITLVPVLAVFVLLAHAVGGIVEKRAMAHAELDARVVARLAVGPGASGGSTRLASGERMGLDRGLRRLAAKRDITGALLWGRGPRPRYAYGAFERREPQRSAAVNAAIAGQSGSEIRPSPHGELVAVFVPVEPSRGRPAGALQVDIPHGPIASDVARDSHRLQLFLAAAVAVAYLALIVVMLLASAELRRRGEERDKDALRDPLTGLPNRALFHELLERAILAGRRRQSLTAVMVMDLDRFKEINDTLGHFNGDQLLQRLAGRLRAVLRDADTIARLGGDEFALLMPDMPDREAVRKAVGRVLQAFEEPFVVGGIALQVQGSVGIALFPEHGKRADAILHAADMAMYVAKAAQSGYEFHSPKEAHNSPDRLALLAELRRGIEDGQLILHYQPKAELSSRRVMGVEALVRWQHPSRGLLPPDEFVSLAEQTGLIRPLTQFVLETALRQCRAWRDDGLELDVAINLSVHNLMDLRFADDLARLIAESKLPPSALQLEITESMIMSEPRRAMSMLSKLKSMGLSLAVDDFGTGYSSLAYLKELPVGVIKIDRSFVIPMLESENDAAIVRSTIDLGRNLGLQVVAEGVESEEAWRTLASYGCDIAQGFHLSRPLAPADLTGWLSSYSELGPSPVPTAAEGV